MFFVIDVNFFVFFEVVDGDSVLMFYIVRFVFLELCCVINVFARRVRSTMISRAYRVVDVFCV